MHRALDENPGIDGRITGFSGNTSALSADELNNIEELQTQDPTLFTLANKQLLESYNIQIVGACCGSDSNHIREIAGILKDRVA